MAPGAANPQELQALFLQANKHKPCCIRIAGAAFKYIADVLEQGQMPANRESAFKAAVLNSISDLTQLSATDAARLVLQHFPDDHAQVVQALKQDSQLQFNYLQAASEVCILLLHCSAAYSMTSTSHITSSHIRAAEAYWYNYDTSCRGLSTLRLAWNNYVQ